MKLLRVDLVNNAQFNMRSIQTKPLVAQSRKNKYEDHNIRDMAFYTSGNVLLKVLPMKGLARRVVTVLDKLVQCRFLSV